MAELIAAVLERRPELERWPEALTAWARAEARVLLISRWHDDVGMFDEAKGQIRAGTDLVKAEGLAQRMRERLGLDPRGEYELRRVQNDAVESTEVLRVILERGQAAIDARPTTGGAYV